VKRAIILIAAGLALASCRDDRQPAVSAETREACKFLRPLVTSRTAARPIKEIEAHRAKVEECDLALSMDRLANPRAAELLFGRLDMERAALDYETLWAQTGEKPPGMP